MRILSKRKLRDSWEKHPGSERPLTHWYNTTRKAAWNHFADARTTFASADQVGQCTVFNIHGNDYRLITKINYEYKVVYVRFILAHTEYDKDVWKKDC